MSNVMALIDHTDPSGDSRAGAAAALRPHERRLLFAAFPLVLAVRVSLCFIPLRQLMPLLSRLAELTAAPQAHADYAPRAARAVARAARLIPGSNSLTLALATLTLLRRRGHTGRLRLGVRRTAAGAGHTHAWVEYNGQVIIGGPATGTAGLTPLPPTYRDTI